MKQIRKYIYITLGFFFVYLSTSCNEDIILFEVDCSQCYVERPEEGPMTIKVTLNEENQEVPITIYLNEYEKNQVRYRDTACYESITVDVYPDRYYSVRAEYKVGDKTVYAIDGDKVELLKASSQCDSVCWVIQGGEVDLRLKYQDKDQLTGK